MSKQVARTIITLALFYFSLGLILLAFFVVNRDGVDGIFPGLVSGLVGYNLLEYLEDI